MNDLVVCEFVVVVKPYTDNYYDIDEHVRIITWNEAWGRKWKVPQEHKDKMLELNSAVVLFISAANSPKFLRIHAPTVKMAMELLEERCPKVHAQIPSFDADKFESIGAACKGSSNLSYSFVPEDNDDDNILWLLPDDMDEDDYVGNFPNIDAFIAAVKEKRKVLFIRCYPDTPVGSWSYHGFDFNELMNHVIKE